MILRTVAIEFRSKQDGRRWRSVWDTIFSVASLAIAFLFGVAFGNIISGVDLNQSGDINESLLDLLNPFALLVGLTAVSMFAVHGLLFLAVKTVGTLEERVRRYTPVALAVFFLLINVTVVITALTQDQISHRFVDDYWPFTFPGAALVAFFLCLRLIRIGLDFFAFLASAAMIGLLLASGAAGMYPNLLISSTDESFNLTVHNGAAANNTLEIMLAFAVIGIPLILLYTSGVYYFFRGKVELDADSY
jgi:cytochrome d ubiquinol oxidase subunit II